MTILLMALASLTAGSFPAAASFHQTVLEGEAEKVAYAWSEKDVEALAGLLAEDGIRLHLPDEEHAKISPRQARAAISSFLGRYGAGAVAVSRVSLSGGAGEKGFAEIRWRTSSPGLSDAVIFTVFVGFVQADGRWTVTEIRVLY